MSLVRPSIRFRFSQWEAVTVKSLQVENRQNEKFTGEMLFTRLLFPYLRLLLLVNLRL